MPRVAFIHLDLGIGGAEQLVVNAATALQNKGYEVQIFTSHHDHNHCFSETIGDGSLAPFIHVHGDWLPRQIFGKCTAFCATIRMIFLSFIVILQSQFLMNKRYNSVFIDGVSSPLPLFPLSGLPVLYYCHFPDKLLCTDRASSFKKFYRKWIDFIEEITTGCATCLVVNSRFTQETFYKSFSSLSSMKVKILYPAINMKNYKLRDSNISQSKTQKKVGPIVSINRFERKKNIELAIETLYELKKILSDDLFEELHLIIAGGYDPAVEENVQYYEELVSLAKKLNLQDHISFRRSISDQERAELLESALCIVYTPANEHFGIVPIEAMFVGVPVIAVASGGPLESVKHEVTGFLCDGNGRSFANAIFELLNNPIKQVEMGKKGHIHVQQNFTTEAFGNNLHLLMQELQKEFILQRRAYTKKLLLICLLIVLLIGTLAFVFL